MKYNLVIFDLDGTLLDTSPGVLGSVRYAEKILNLKPIAEEELYEFVGPPPAMRATCAHRKYGMEKAIYEAEKYEGMEEVLRELKRSNIILAVATLKKQRIAETILENFGIKEYFDIITGMNDEETLTKKITIEKAMRTTGVSSALMVGDSTYDYYGATEARVDFVGVLYGFGFRKGIVYPFPTVNEPCELLKLILDF